MPKNIDTDRGVIIAQDKKTGVNIFMYKDNPGVYLDTYGREVSESLAKDAGIDIERFGKAKARKAMQSAAMAEIEKQLELNETSKVIVEREGYSVKMNAAGWCQILDPDGQVMNTVALPEANALELFNRLVPAPKEEEPKPAPVRGVPYKPKEKAQKEADKQG